MAWYRTGTITITQGSATITGDGTNWIRQHPGWAMVIEGVDGLREIREVVSSTELTLQAPITEASAAGLSYYIIQTHGLNANLIEKINALITDVNNSKEAWDLVYSDFSSTVYQLWLDQGNTGTPSEFLATLKGDKGNKGNTGPSTFDEWLSAGNTGTFDDFLDELSGQAIAAAEAARDAAQAAQGGAEAAQTAAQGEATAAGAAKTATEAARDAALSAQGGAEAAQAASEAARDAALSAQGGAEAAQAASEAARNAAQAAQGGAETARDAAQAAQGGAGTARDKSQAWAEAAEDAEVEAGQFSALHHAAKAAASAGAAASSADAAETAKTQTEAARDEARRWYLGPHASDQAATDHATAESIPLTDGVWYWNTSSGAGRIYDGANFTAAAFDTSGALVAANNLSELTDAAAARGNLGLGTAATMSADHVNKAAKLAAALPIIFGS